MLLLYLNTGNDRRIGKNFEFFQNGDLTKILL